MYAQPQKAYIIKKYDDEHRDYQKVKTIYEYSKALYIEARKQLQDDLDVTTYYNQNILPTTSQYINDDLISDIKTLAMNDNDHNIKRKMTKNSRFMMNVYDSDMTYLLDQIKINVINLVIDFDFVQNIIRTYDFSIKKVNKDYFVRVECAFDLIQQDQLLFKYHDVIIDSDYKESSNNQNKLIICLLHQDFVSQNNVIYVENKKDDQTSLTNLQALYEAQDNYSHLNLNRDQLIAYQLHDLMT